jgi:hypothetical protein
VVGFDGGDSFDVEGHSVRLALRSPRLFVYLPSCVRQRSCAFRRRGRSIDSAVFQLLISCEQQAVPLQRSKRSRILVPPSWRRWPPACGRRSLDSPASKAAILPESDLPLRGADLPPVGRTLPAASTPVA